MYPIKSIQHHEQALRDMDDNPSKGLVRYHMTAICALKLGEAHGIDGPAAEYRRGGKVIIRQVENKLRAEAGEHGTIFTTTELKPDDQS